MYASSRASSRVSITVLAHCRNSFILHTPPKHQFPPIFSIQFHSIHFHHPQYKAFTGQVSILNHSALNTSVFQRFGISSSSSSSTQTDEKETYDEKENIEVHEQKEPGSTVEPQIKTFQYNKRSSSSTKGNAFSDSDLDVDDDMPVVDLIKRLTQTEELLKSKDKEIEKMKDKVLQTYAEMENVMDRTRREADNSKKFAIQNFAKSLLDVADNLGRASSVVKESFSKIDTSIDTAGAVPLLKTLLEGVEMTEKQLAEVFKKFGVERYDPTNEQFDPNRHNAVFQVPDPLKAPDTIAVVLKPGYMLYDRVIRPAEVGVAVSVDT